MPILQTIAPRDHDLGGGFVVRRVLPASVRQAIGPFVFVDHFGPVTSAPDQNQDVRPHPHIGLATVTYLFEGAMMHRDSTGVVQRIEPGAVNWMTAGRGIVHSERTPDDLRGSTRRSHGLQLWCALPIEREEDAPSFQHAAAADIPVCTVAGASVRVLVGSAFGASSPVRSVSPTLYLDIALQADVPFALPPLQPDLAVYAVDSALLVDGAPLAQHTMGVLQPGQTTLLTAPAATRLVVLGGEPLGPRFMVWNFVSSSRERILQAQEDWRALRFPMVPGETEYIPLPPQK